MTRSQVERVVILGRGGSGKSSFASRLSEISELPVIELRVFRSPSQARRFLADARTPTS